LDMSGPGANRPEGIVRAKLREETSGRNILILTQDYKFLLATIKICATLVNTHTHIHTHRERERERERNSF